MMDVLTRLGLVPRGGNYETTWRRIEELGLDASHLRHRRGRPLWKLDVTDLLEAVRTSRSYAEVGAKLGIKAGGGSHERLKRRIEHLGADTSHFLGQGWRRNDRRPTVPARPLSELLVEGRSVRTSGLKERLISEGLKPRRCEMCGGSEWNGRPIPLELDHVNGRREDNRLANLRLLCPNCHAQTDTYRGRNIGVRSV
jgi:HNH endonuclease